MRLAAALLLIGCGSSAQPAAVAPPPEVRCYDGVWRSSSMGNEEETAVLLRRTVAPASRSITEQWHFAGQPDDLVHELVVDGASFSGVTRGDRTPRTTAGTLDGTAWQWNRWTFRGESETGFAWDLEATRTDAAIDITGTSGGRGDEFPANLAIHRAAFDCAGWETRLAARNQLILFYTLTLSILWII